MTQIWKWGRKKDRGRDIAVRGLEGRERERERGGGDWGRERSFQML